MNNKENKIKERVLGELAEKLAFEAIRNPQLLESIKDIAKNLGLPVEDILIS